MGYLGEQSFLRSICYFLNKYWHIGVGNIHHNYLGFLLLLLLLLFWGILRITRGKGKVLGRFSLDQILRQETGDTWFSWEVTAGSMVREQESKTGKGKKNNH